MNLPIYLDYASTTPVDPRVVEKMQDCLSMEGNFGNPASRSHAFGWKAEEATEQARQHVADLVNCDTREIVWKAFNNRAVKENSPILEEAVQLRNEKALLFGFKTWAEYRLQNRMAKSPKNVASMYESLIPKLQKAAEVEKIELAIDNIEISDITPWDIRYFISKERSKVSSIENQKGNIVDMGMDIDS